MCVRVKSTARMLSVHVAILQLGHLLIGLLGTYACLKGDKLLTTPPSNVPGQLIIGCGASMAGNQCGYSLLGKSTSTHCFHANNYKWCTHEVISRMYGDSMESTTMNSGICSLIWAGMSLPDYLAPRTDKLIYLQRTVIPPSTIIILFIEFTQCHVIYQ